MIQEAAKRGGGFNLHSGGWDQILAKHNEQSGGLGRHERHGRQRGVMGSNGGGGGGASNSESILNLLLNGTYGTAVRVGLR